MKSVCLAILNYNWKNDFEHLLATSGEANLFTASASAADACTELPARRVHSVFPNPPKGQVPQCESE